MGGASREEPAAKPEPRPRAEVPGGEPPRLRVIVDHEVVRESVVDGPLTLGRDGDNDVVLDDDRASGRHGRIDASRGRWRYTDLGSRNGSVVAAGPSLGEGESFEMTERTQIRLGRTVVEFRPGTTADEGEVPAPGGHGTASGARAPEEAATGPDEGPSVRPRLVLVLDGRAETRALPAGSAVVGRAEGCDVVVPHPSVSARHAELRFTGRGWELHDLGSTNGTRVGIKPVRDGHPVVNGSHAILGAVDALFVHDGPYRSERERPPAAEPFVAWLRRRRLLTRAQAGEVLAACEAGEQLVEALVSRGLLGPGELTELRHEAPLAAGEGPAARRRRGLWIVAALLAAAAAAWVLGR